MKAGGRYTIMIGEPIDGRSFAEGKGVRSMKWLWELIQSLFYWCFVDYWVSGLTLVILYSYIMCIWVDEALKKNILLGALLAVFAVSIVGLLVYYYFRNRHILLGLASIVLVGVVIYMVYIEPYIR